MTPAIERPEWFTKESYLQLKENGLMDRYIASDMLFVSMRTFARFKRELGVTGGHRGGHNRKVDYKKAKELHKQGIPISSIAKRYNASYITAYKAIMY